MLFADHRLSRDIDAFIDDPQYLALLSPETADVWKCSSWDLRHSGYQHPFRRISARAAQLHQVKRKKDDLLRRVDGIRDDFVRAELQELDIRPEWEDHKGTCLATVRALIRRIPST